MQEDAECGKDAKISSLDSKVSQECAVGNVSTKSGDAKRPRVLMKSIEAELVETIHSSGTTECRNIQSMAQSY